MLWIRHWPRGALNSRGAKFDQLSWWAQSDQLPRLLARLDLTPRVVGVPLPVLPRRMLPQPDHVLIVGMADQRRVGVSHGRHSAPVLPFVDFRMAIHERNAGRPGMEAGRQVR